MNPAVRPSILSEETSVLDSMHKMLDQIFQILLVSAHWPLPVYTTFSSLDHAWWSQGSSCLDFCLTKLCEPEIGSVDSDTDDNSYHEYDGCIPVRWD